MRISILTLFPEMFEGPFKYSIIKRAKEKKLLQIEFINIRDFGIGKHRIVDDTPYGGGVGMVMRVDVLHKAIAYVKEKTSKELGNNTLSKIILLSAAGITFKQSTAREFSQLDHLILICGHYEGVDERILQYVDGEVSIGDYVVTGGEIPSMIITDAVTRLIPGVITEGATEEESFSNAGASNHTVVGANDNSPLRVGANNYSPLRVIPLRANDNSPLLEYPHYTKPQIYDNKNIPEILLSGNHQKIKEWRHDQALKKTKLNRPDLLNK